ncbi:hypothetical protein JOF28_000304 [Leucobacter exalbidus]|uniref:MobA/VirD2-like nuclease domain-containing protein n=1 Tax=Leucobacter exalbidus TaxID=662960 RepID=A0A940PJK0_9MICO|nr:hypothetical protein [Leucobacter exalbidus]
MYNAIQSSDSASRIIGYVLNEKLDAEVDRCMYASGIGCVASTAKADFADTRDRFDPNDKLTVQAYSAVISASKEEFDPADPEQVYQFHMVSQHAAEMTFPGRQILVGTQIDGETGLVHSHWVISNVAHEDAEMTHTVKGKQVTEKVVAGKPFSSAMSNVFRIREATNAVLADEQFMASVGYDNSRLGKLMSVRAGLDSQGLNFLVGEHAYDNTALVRSTRSTNGWLGELKARVEHAKAEATSEESFRELLTHDGAVVLNERGKNKTWSYTYTDGADRTHTARAGSKRLHSNDFSRNAILVAAKENKIAAETRQVSPQVLAFEAQQAAQQARFDQRQAAREASTQAKIAANELASQKRLAERADVKAAADALRASKDAEHQKAVRAVLDNPPARFAQLSDAARMEQLDKLMIVKEEQAVGLSKRFRTGQREAMRRAHGLSYDEAKYLDTLWEEQGCPGTASERPAEQLIEDEPAERTEVVSESPVALEPQRKQAAQNEVNAGGPTFAQLLADVEDATPESDTSWLEKFYPSRPRQVPSPEPVEQEAPAKPEAVIVEAEEPQPEHVDAPVAESELVDPVELTRTVVAAPVEQEPAVPDAPRESLLRMVQRPNQRKQRAITAMAEFEEQHAWRALADAQHFDDSRVPSGIGKAWLDEFGDYLDPAVNEQLRLRVALLEARDAEYTAGRAVLTERSGLETAGGFVDRHAPRFKKIDRELRCSNKRREWLVAKLTAGDYDISDEDRSAYLKAVIDENAAQIDQPNHESDQQLSVQ